MTDKERVKTFMAQIHKEWAEKYRAGEPIKSIIEASGYHHSYVRAILRDEGISLRSPVSKVLIRKWASLRRDGRTLQSIADDYGVSVTKIYLYTRDICKGDKRG